MAAYTASKYALQGWTEVLRAELAGSGVHVATIHPGDIGGEGGGAVGGGVGAFAAGLGSRVCRRGGRRGPFSAGWCAEEGLPAAQAGWGCNLAGAM